MKRIFSFIVLVGLSISVFSQSDSPIENKTKIFTYGIELDAIPFINGGYSFSAWIGLNNDRQRIRPVISKSDMPYILNYDGLKSNDVKMYAIMTDYFFKPEFEKLFITTGIQYWDGLVTTSDNATGTYNEWIFTLSVGYSWKFAGNFYLNPNVSGHFRIAGDEEVQIGNDVYNTSMAIPYFSINIGWNI